VPRSPPPTLQLNKVSMPQQPEKVGGLEKIQENSNVGMPGTYNQYHLPATTGVTAEFLQNNFPSWSAVLSRQQQQQPNLVPPSPADSNKVVSHNVYLRSQRINLMHLIGSLACISISHR
jgi:hypothetical protein